MSEPNVEPVQPPNAPPPSPPPADPPADLPKLGGADPGDPPPSDPPADPPAEPKAVSFDDDWRAHLAGDDTEALERLSRIKTPQDLAKEVVRQNKELSKRQANGAFPEEGSDEDKAEWRKANGVPEKGTISEYGIKTPEGYDMSEVEKGMLDDFVSTLHGINAPSGQVQTAVDFWFKANAANQQANNELDSQRNREWDGEIASDLGKDKETMLAAANAYIENRIGDETLRNELLNARLPGGGIVAKHPEFVKMWIDLALQNGYADRIEANSLEAGGKSIIEQIHEIEALQSKDRQRYDASKDKLLKLYAAADSKGLKF
ncbi:MAG: hypothetical protein AAGD43_18055 [Pseudomonadota bacterium]